MKKQIGYENRKVFLPERKNNDELVHTTNND